MTRPVFEVLKELESLHKRAVAQQEAAIAAVGDYKRGLDEMAESLGFAVRHRDETPDVSGGGVPYMSAGTNIPPRDDGMYPHEFPPRVPYPELLPRDERPITPSDL